MYFLINYKLIRGDLWLDEAENDDRKLVKSRANTSHIRRIYEENLRSEIKRDRMSPCQPFYDADFAQKFFANFFLYGSP